MSTSGATTLTEEQVAQAASHPAFAPYTRADIRDDVIRFGWISDGVVVLSHETGSLCRLQSTAECPFAFTPERCTASGAQPTSEGHPLAGVGETDHLVTITDLSGELLADQISILSAGELVIRNETLYTALSEGILVCPVAKLQNLRKRLGIAESSGASPTGPSQTNEVETEPSIVPACRAFSRALAEGVVTTNFLPKDAKFYTTKQQQEVGKRTPQPDARKDKVSSGHPAVPTTGPSVPSPPPEPTAEPVPTAWYSVPPTSKFTFTATTLRKWVERRLPDGPVLNACAGVVCLDHSSEIVRNDLKRSYTLERPREINGIQYGAGDEVPTNADLHCDVAELAANLDRSFSAVIFDPPWSIYQTNLRYEHGKKLVKNSIESPIDPTNLPFDVPRLSGDTEKQKQQVGHARLAKLNFDYLLKPGGQLIQLTQHGTAGAASLGYEQLERAVFNPVGEAKAVIGSVDKKPGGTVKTTTDQRGLSDFTE